LRTSGALRLHVAFARADGTFVPPEHCDRSISPTRIIPRRARSVGRSVRAGYFELMRKTSLVAAALVTSSWNVLRAQDAPVAGSISGIVVDDNGRPIPGVDVHAFPEAARATTDSAGRFVITKLGAGFYHVRARRLGYSPLEITTDLATRGHVELKFELKARPAILDSVVISASGKCPDVSYSGFNCRRHTGKGLYLTDDDIADKGAIELGEVFTDVPGFRVEAGMTRLGTRPIPRSTRGNRCLNALVNGRPLAVTNQLPHYATELIAVEIYASPNDVPPEYQRYVWLASTRQTSAVLGHDLPNQRCALVVYWTEFT
jgi:hypothetical protein